MRLLRNRWVVWAIVIALADGSTAGDHRFAGGAGTPDDPYRIATAEQLVTIGGSTALLDKCFELVRDIDLDPNLPGRRVFRHAVIAPEGGMDAEGKGFAGQFDGRGRTIRNLTIRGRPGYNLGLFGSIQRGACVHDLNLENVSIRGRENVGALAAVVDGTVRMCRAAGTIHAAASFTLVGGLVGLGRGRVEDCHSRVMIRAEDACRGDRVGGLVGSNVVGLIVDSDATGSVTSGNGSENVGGLVGCNYSGTIRNCHASGAVRSGKKSHGVGGLMGKSTGFVAQCYATGPVACDSESGGLGGLTGWGGGALLDCYATGAVHGAEKCRAIGGLAGGGAYDSMVYRCYACGPVSGGEGSEGLGGLIGDASSGGTKGASEQVKSCFWDTERTGQPRGAGGAGLNTAGMQQGRTFQDAGWDMAGDRQDGLADTWYIPAGGGYPRLSVFANQERGRRLAGQGTADHPFLIASPEDLTLVNQTGRAACYKLTADLDLAGIAWTTSPLGAFVGEFNGDGHRIRNVTVQEKFSIYTGLFASIGEGSRVFGLGLENVDINGSRDVGGLAGYCAGTVASCYVTGRVRHLGDGGVGGIVGHNCGRIIQSYAQCQVTGGTGESVPGSLVGCNYSGAIINCCATGPVSISPREKPSAQKDVAHANEVNGNLAGSNPYAYCGNVWDFERYGLSQSREGYEWNTLAGMDLKSWLAKGWDFVGERGNGTVDLWYLAQDSNCPRLALFSNTRERPRLGGQGVPNDPYRIATAQDLGAVYYHDWSAHYQLVADVDLSGITWSTAPLMEFHGHLDGAGHAVRDLTVRGDTDLGLFGVLGSHAVVENLRVEDANITGADQTQCLGLLAAHSHGKIRNCHATGVIKTGSKSSRIGGLVGSNEGDLSDCGTAVRIVSGARACAVGGLLGESKSGKVFACQARGEISCGPESTEIGGLLGTLFWEESVSNCSAAIRLTCAEKSACLGGLVGGIFQGDVIFHKGSIAYCYAVGPIQAGAATKGIGGLLGSATRGWNGAITNSYYSDAIRTDHAGVGEGTRLSIEEMKRKASFKKWDFKSVWQVSEGQDYPKLRGQP